MIAKRELHILNKMGLHARPAAEFVRCVRTFKSQITLQKGDEEFSGSSILEILMANLDCGSSVLIVANGSDAEPALNKLEALLYEFKLQEG